MHLEIKNLGFTKLELELVISGAFPGNPRRKFHRIRCVFQMCICIGFKLL